MVQFSSQSLTGGLIINYGVDEKTCTVANGVAISTEAIMAMDLEEAMLKASEEEDIARGIQSM